MTPLPVSPHTFTLCHISAFLSGSRGISVSHLSLPRYFDVHDIRCTYPRFRSYVAVAICVRLWPVRSFRNALDSTTLPNRSFFYAQSLPHRRPPWITTATHSRDMLSQSGKYGAGAGTRTLNPLLTKQLLYHWSYVSMAGAERFELSPKVLETFMLPLHQTPIWRPRRVLIPLPPA